MSGLGSQCGIGDKYSGTNSHEMNNRVHNTTHRLEYCILHYVYVDEQVKKNDRVHKWLPDVVADWGGVPSVSIGTQRNESNATELNTKARRLPHQGSLLQR